ncbi:MAG: hypothetical protein INR65_15610 [Gluconacetobacter diazotrophicus]|nr:hypothetical protein [Gluconacetobacter diazotrophicus]
MGEYGILVGAAGPDGWTVLVVAATALPLGAAMLLAAGAVARAVGLASARPTVPAGRSWGGRREPCAGRCC